MAVPGGHALPPDYAVKPFLLRHCDRHIYVDTEQI